MSKGMKIPGKTLTSHLGAMAARMPSALKTEMSEVYCEAKVVSSNVFLEAHSPYDLDAPMRPYLHILGEVRELKSEQFPDGAHTLVFSEGTGPSVDYFYEFSNSELAGLAEKGLFDPGFQVPEILYGNEFFLPCICEVVSVKPLEDDAHRIPVVFANIVDAHDMLISEENCGYRLEEYFTPPEIDEFADFMDIPDIEVSDSLFDEQHDLDEQIEAVIEDDMTEEESRVAKDYAEIRRRVAENHEKRHMVMPAPNASVDAERLAERIARHKELEPLPDAPGVADIDVTYEAVPVTPIEQAYESTDAPVDVEVEGIDEDAVLKAPETPRFIEDAPLPQTTEHAVPAHLEEVALAADQERDDEFLDISDSI